MSMNTDLKNMYRGISILQSSSHRFSLKGTEFVLPCFIFAISQNALIYQVVQLVGEKKQQSYYSVDVPDKYVSGINFYKA